MVFPASNAHIGYWRVKLNKKQCDKTAVTSHNELYRLAGIPIRSGNAQETFKRAVVVLLLPEKRHYDVVYLEHIVLFSRSSNRPLVQIRWVLNLPKCARINFKLNNLAYLPNQSILLDTSCD